jgi:hypothetical protein
MDATATATPCRVPLTDIDSRSPQHREALSRLLPGADKRHENPTFNSAL